MPAALRVLFWSDSFWPSIGGVETWAARYVQCLGERGFEVVVVTTHREFDTPDQELFQGVPVYRLPLWSALEGRRPGAILRAKQAIARLRQDIAPDRLHVNTIGATSAFYLWTRHVAPCPTLFTLHGPWPDEYARSGSLLDQALGAADRVIAVSRSTRDWALAFAPRLASRMQVIHPATDPRPVAPSAPSPILLCLGRLSREKGFDLAIDAFARIHETYPDARLLVAGHGGEYDALTRLAAQRGVAGKVTFRGWVSPGEVSDLIARAAIVVVPSRQEGFGLVALEAAHLARPVAGFATGGLDEAIVDGETGLLAAPQDSGALAHKLACLLDDAGLRRRLGHAARRRARTEFGWDAHMNRYACALRHLRYAAPLPAETGTCE